VSEPSGPPWLVRCARRVRALGRCGVARVAGAGSRARGAFWRALLPRLAPLVRRMAETGEGTDACLAQGCLPLPVHFYSPVPDLAELRARGMFRRRSPLAGLDLRIDEQLRLLAELGRDYAAECRWSLAPTPDPAEFFSENSGFSFGCAASTHGLLRRSKPRRVIEVGSGMSSCVIAAALRANQKQGAPRAEYLVVDPHPSHRLDALAEVSERLREKVEQIPTQRFEALEAGDVLFVDSGHVVRIGGDVNFLVLDVLPRLAPGVLAHFHDIPMPYEYAESYYTNPGFRMLWTESYLLQAFLCHNTVWRTLLAMNLLMTEHADAFRAAFPHWDPARQQGPSHSYWIRRERP
jgi:hypothetical protein